MSRFALPVEYFSFDLKFSGSKLRNAALHGEHKAFEECLERNPVEAEWVISSLFYILGLVTRKVRTISEITPTLKLLLRYSGKTRLFYSNWTPYHVICLATGDQHELLELIIEEFGASLIDATNSDLLTPLICAVQRTNFKCVEKLIAHGADVKCQGFMGVSVDPLIDSIANFHYNSNGSYEVMMDIFDVLLNSGVDVNRTCNLNWRTPIMHAAEMGITKCIQRLIQKGARLDSVDKFGHTVWTLAALKGGVEVLKLLLEDGGIDKNSMDNNGFSLLYWAVRGGNIQTVTYLLDLGVKITTNRSQESVQLCRICGTNLSCYIINGRQRSIDPYMEAIRLNMLEVLKLMDEYGCQLYKSVDTLNYAIHINSVKVIDYLLCKHKYSLNDEYFERFFGRDWMTLNQTLLLKACRTASEQVVQLLLEHGADPNQMGCVQGITVNSTIIEAIHKRHVGTIALFIRSGLKVNIRSYHRHVGSVLPFEAAVYTDHIYAAKMLLFTGSSCGVHSLNNNHKLKTGTTNELKELLKEWNVHKNNVIPLQQRCRMAILNHLSPQADKKISELPLPQILVKYLTIPELDDIINVDVF